MQTVYPIHSRTTPKKGIFSINVPTTARKGSSPGGPFASFPLFGANAGHFQRFKVNKIPRSHKFNPIQNLESKIYSLSTFRITNLAVYHPSCAPARGRGARPARGAGGPAGRGALIYVYFMHEREVCTSPLLIKLNDVLYIELLFNLMLTAPYTYATCGTVRVTVHV